MVQEAISQIMASGWATVILAFVLGLVFGLAVNAGATERQGDVRADGRKEPALDAKLASETGKKLGAIEEEIKKTKSLLDSLQDKDEALSADLDAVDNAVKRANGRLKLILKSVARAKDAE